MKLAQATDMLRIRSLVPLASSATGYYGLCGTIILVLLAAAPAIAETFRSDSKRFEHSKMDIVVTETERHSRTSVVNIQIKAVGSSVGSSFFLLCSVRDLARQRGNYRYIAKVEEQPRRDHMLIGFLQSVTEPPEQLDSRLRSQPVIDLEQFSPICDKMK
jgi:hypothetical protein